MKWGKMLAAMLVGLLGMSGPARADDGTAAEIQVLKERLARLEEAQQAAPPPPEGGSFVNLPSGFGSINMSGFVDSTYTYNFNQPATGTNTLRVFDNRHNGFMLNNAQLTLEKPVSTDSPAGFKTELMFGQDAEVIGPLSAGLGSGTDELEIQEAYVNYLAPLGNGLDLKVGKMATLVGAEVIESKDNWNISRSYLFGFAQPATHTGARASYVWNDMVSTAVEVNNGWDVVDDNNRAKSVGFNVGVTPAEGVWIGTTYIAGAEQGTDSSQKRQLVDLVASWQATDALALKLNYDWATEEGGGSSSTDDAVWQGLAGYARYQLTEKAAVSLRGEFLNDADGVRTLFTSGINGVVDDNIRVYGLTLTGEYKLTSNLLARLEYRHDAANASVFAEDDAGLESTQDTVAMQFIALF